MLKTLYPAVLYLQDGKCYRGWSLFKLPVCSGEIVFNTGMTGYQEIITDPSYSGQMVLFTYPEIGNTGLNSSDNESDMVYIKALIAKNISNLSNNWRSNLSLIDFIYDKGLPHIIGIDTRSLTKYIRLHGVTNAVVTDSNFNLNLVTFKFFNADSMNFVRSVSFDAPYRTNPDICDYSHNCLIFRHSTFYRSKTYSKPSKAYRIVVISFGLKFNILRSLLYLGIDIVVLPYNCSYFDVLSCKPDGLLLSNGPGNPSKLVSSINTVRRLVVFSKLPIWGICMGHQVLNLALGVSTFKLKFGHRGLNHPSGYLSYAEITSQNHGFAVSGDSISKNHICTFLRSNAYNLNDFTVSSTWHKNKPIFSVQYHPEASPGPHDSMYLFKIFIELIKSAKSCAM